MSTPTLQWGRYDLSTLSMTKYEFIQLQQESTDHNLYPFTLKGIAFVIGWNLILEYAIGTASVARGYSSYLDHLLGNIMSTTFKKYIPLNLGPHLSPYLDLCAFAVTILLTVILRYTKLKLNQQMIYSYTKLICRGIGGLIFQYLLFQHWSQSINAFQQYIYLLKCMRRNVCNRCWSFPCRS